MAVNQSKLTQNVQVYETGPGRSPSSRSVSRRKVDHLSTRVDHRVMEEYRHTWSSAKADVERLNQHHVT
jgi:hypothetical protein